jgi:hypothetical protein
MNGSIHSNSLNVSDVTFQVGQARAGRNPPINMRYNGGNLLIRLPKVGYPGGVLIREGDTGNKTYTLIGSLKGCDPYGKDRSTAADDLGKLYNLLTDLENHIIKAAVENSSKWFGKKRSEEAIRDSFKRILSFSTDKVDGEYVPNGKYPPSFRVKVPVYDNRVNTEIFDASKNPVFATPESLNSVFPKGVEANLVVSGSIYVIAGGGFGVTWRLTAAQVFPQVRRTAADMFDDESGAAPTVVEEDAPAPAQDEDSEYGGGQVAQPDVQAQVEVQVPAAAPAKKGGRRVPAGGAGSA